MNEEQIKVSIIIPIYNMQKYLSECLDSVLSQTLQEIEILCINDGSTDKTSEIIAHYESTHNSIRVINTENHGASGARNLGIREAKGTYVIFMDADDYYPSNCVLEHLYCAAEKYHVKVAGGEFGEIDTTGYVREGKDFDEERLFGYHFSHEKVINYIDYQFDFGYTRFLFNKRMLLDNNITFPQLVYFEDPPFLVKALSTAVDFAAVPETVYMYRIGHKDIDWNKKKSTDLFEGLFMNLRFAKEQGYSKLYNLTIARMMIDYECVVKYHVEALEDIERIACDNANLIHDKRQLRQLLTVLNPYQGAVSNSISYKIGLVITFVPRKIIYFFKHTLF